MSKNILASWKEKLKCKKISCMDFFTRICVSKSKSLAILKALKRLSSYLDLSYRDIQEMLSARGIDVCYSTIQRWVKEHGPVLYQLWKKKNKSASAHWKMDETYIKIKGKWHYLYRANDSKGMTLDIWLRRRRDTQSVYTFFKRLLKQFGEPRVIATDKASSIISAFTKLQKQGKYKKTEHRRIKFLNNLIDQDHRKIKMRSKSYKSLRSASATIKDMETIHALYKKHRREGNFFGFSALNEVTNLLAA